MFDSVRPHRRQPARLPCPWDSPGMNTGVGCHFLLQCIRVKSESEVAQSCPTLSDPMDCSPPGSSIHGIFPGKSTGVGCHCLLRAYYRYWLAGAVVLAACRGHHREGKKTREEWAIPPKAHIPSVEHPHSASPLGSQGHWNGCS